MPNCKSFVTDGQQKSANHSGSPTNTADCIYQYVTIMDQNQANFYK